MEVARIDGRLRFCAYETYEGLRRNYICGHHEYCCTLGCCVSSSFSFYQLWYFWLLLLLMILMCSGGGWWYRWRHHTNYARTPTTTRRRRGRTEARGRNGRIYPHQGGQYPPHAAYSLPEHVDKDPPSYNDVVRHLSHFPPASSVFNGNHHARSHNSTLENNNDYWAPTHPPPSYEMVLDLKRQQQHLESEIRAEESRQQSSDATQSTSQGARDRVRMLLRFNRSEQGSSDESPPAPFYINPPPAPTSSHEQARYAMSSDTQLPPSLVGTENLVILPTESTHKIGSQSGAQPHMTAAAHNTPSCTTNTNQPFIISISDPSSSSESVVSGSTPSTSAIPHPSSYSSSYSDSRHRLGVTTPPPIRASPNQEDVDHCSTFEEPRSRSPSSTVSRAELSSASGNNKASVSLSTLSRPSTSISVRSRTTERRTSLPGALSEADERTVSVQNNSSPDMSDLQQQEDTHVHTEHNN